jgi:putative membrane protein
MMGGAGTMMWLMWLVVPLSILAVSAVIVFVVIALTRHGGMASNNPTPPHAASPRDILDERYARGEIDNDDYLRRREHLK